MASNNGTLLGPRSGECSNPGIWPLENVETGESEAPALSLRCAPEPDPTEVESTDEGNPTAPFECCLGDMDVAATAARICCVPSS